VESQAVRALIQPQNGERHERASKQSWPSEMGRGVGAGRRGLLTRSRCAWIRV